MMEYVTQAEYRKAKSNLTRAINSKDPLKVIKTCRETHQAWEGKAWPDDWSRWANAHDDAIYQLQWESVSWRW